MPWRALGGAVAAYDSVLEHTFAATEFQAPWGDTPMVNGDIGVHFKMFKAGNVRSVVSEDFHPHAEWMKRKAFRLQDALEQVLTSAAEGGSIWRVAVLVHGFGDAVGNGSTDASSWPALAATMMVKQSRQLAIVVGWGKGASSYLQYSKAMSSTRVVALYLARLLAATHHALGTVVKTWCIGHSLGAHICGLAGKYAKEVGIPRWHFISALDPAGPSVTSCRLLVTSWVEPAFSTARLAPDDADDSEALYTDWAGLGFHPVLAACIDKQHKRAWWHFSDCTKQPVRLANVEVFVNPQVYTASGSVIPPWFPDQAFMQPGCTITQTMFGCSHFYAAQLLLLSFRLGQYDFPGLHITAACGTTDRTLTPLNVCPEGSVVNRFRILVGPTSSLGVVLLIRGIAGIFPGVTHHRYGTYVLDPSLPTIVELALLFPGTRWGR